MNRRAFMLATVLILIPLGVLLAFSTVRTLLVESGLSIQSQHKARVFYLAEAGIEVAYRVFGLNNYNQYTHENDGVTPTANGLALYGVPGINLQKDASGWVAWSWKPGDPVKDSFTRSGLPESYRFQVYSPQANRWRLICEATVNTRVCRQQLDGELESCTNYTVFDNSDTSDFSLAEHHVIEGKVHANGNLYLKPWKTKGFAILPGITPWLVRPVLNPSVEIVGGAQVQAAGQILRWRDAWARPDEGGTVNITNVMTNSPVTMPGYDQGAGGQFNAFDSDHKDWKDPIVGAVSRWGGAVSDGTLGAKKKSIPGREALLPGGFYDQKAGLHIDASTSAPWAKDVSFGNLAEGRNVTVKEIDISQIGSDFPANGVIYSSVPVRLVNGERLPGKLTLASCATIYVKSDFNMEKPTAASSVSEVKPALLVTTDRVYSLTSSFNDANSSNLPDPFNPSSMPKATDPPKHANDAPNVVEQNANIMDGKPTTESRAWKDDGSNNIYYVPGGTYKHPLTGDDTRAKKVSDSPLQVAYPTASDMLENWQDLRFVTRGAKIHMRNAKMARYDNADADPSSPLYNSSITPWIVRSNHFPPRDQGGQRGREYKFDSKVSDEVPVVPNTARRLRWKVIEG